MVIKVKSLFVLWFWRATFKKLSLHNLSVLQSTFTWDLLHPVHTYLGLAPLDLLLRKQEKNDSKVFLRTQW